MQAICTSILPLPFVSPDYFHPARSFQNDRSYLNIHLVPRRKSSSVHRPTRLWVCFPKFKVLAKSKMEHAMQSDGPTLLRTDEICAGLITLDLINVTFWRMTSVGHAPSLQ